MTPIPESRFNRAGLMLAGAVALVVAALALWRPVTTFDLKLLDGWQALSSRVAAPGPADRVVVVGIDEDTAKALPEPMTLWHRRLGQFLEAMRVAPPVAVGFDLVLPGRSYDDVVPGLDSAFLRGLLLTRSAFPTILGRTVDEGGVPRPLLPSFVTAAGVEPGFALWSRDVDGGMRRFDERLGSSGEAVPTLAGQLVRAAGGEPGTGYVDFRIGEPFGYVPLVEVLRAAERGDGAWLQSRFEGRIVLLGVVMPFLDEVRVPVRLAAWGPPPEATPGVLLQAQAVRAMLANRLLPPVAPHWVALGVILVALAAGLTARAGWGSALAALALAGLGVAFSQAFEAGYVFPIGWALLAVTLAYCARQGASVTARLLERRRLRKSFSGYVSPGVMSEILKGTITPDAGGEEREVCLLFSDIRGYTTRSEGMKPAELLAFLNEYFDGVVKILHRHDGAVTCFMGDGIMAVFGAPRPLENPSQAAFDAAREMVENLAQVNASLSGDGKPPIDVGIGLHTGRAVLGHVGGKDRHDYTAIGDVPNVASRLEGSTKEAGYRIVVSEAVAARLAERERLVPLGPLALKGRSPVVSFGFDPVAGGRADVPSSPATTPPKSP